MREYLITENPDPTALLKFQVHSRPKSKWTRFWLGPYAVDYEQSFRTKAEALEFCSRKLNPKCEVVS